MTTLAFALLSIPAAQASSSGVAETHNPGGVTTRATPDSSSGGSSVVRGGLSELGSPVNDSAKGAPELSRYLQAVTQRLRTGVQERRSATWRHQDWLGQGRTKTAYRERSTRSRPYLRWIRSLWSHRAHRLYKLRAHTLRDFSFCEGCDAWPRAVDEVQRVFPNTESWLLSCSDAEGWSPGFDRWVGYAGVGYSAYLRDSGTVGGPLQFRFGTFTWAWHRGREYALERGFRFGGHLRDDTTAWRSALGQAVAGGWARYTGNDNSHWSASWSNGCR